MSEVLSLDSVARLAWLATQGQNSTLTNAAYANPTRTTGLVELGLCHRPDNTIAAVTVIHVWAKSRLKPS